MSKLKDIIKTIAAFLVHPIYLIRDNCRLFHCTIHGGKGNRLQMKDAWLTDTVISFQGSDNEISVHDCHLFNSNIFIRGTGHRILIDSGVQLFNVRIKVIGHNNTIRIGKGTRFGGGNIIHGGESLEISIGRYCYFAEGIDIWSTDTHSIYDAENRGVALNKPLSIIIGNHVWAGKDVAILKGVHIGDDSVIGMRTLVTKDIPAGTLNVGSPSRVIRSGIIWNPTNPD